MNEHSPIEFIYNNLTQQSSSIKESIVKQNNQPINNHNKNIKKDKHELILPKSYK